MLIKANQNETLRSNATIPKWKCGEKMEKENFRSDHELLTSNNSVPPIRVFAAAKLLVSFI